VDGRLALSILLVLAASAKPSSAAPHEDAVMQADHSLIAALGSSDSKSAAKLLDSDFAWTDEQGQTRDKRATLNEFEAFADENKTDSVDAHFCGQFGFVYGTHHGARFVRIWVKREKGWQLFVNVDTPVAAKPQPTTSSREVQGSGADCDSRCRTLPFKPIAPDKKIVAGWPQSKAFHPHSDAGNWATQIAERFDTA